MKKSYTQQGLLSIVQFKIAKNHKKTKKTQHQQRQQHQQKTKQK